VSKPRQVPELEPCPRCGIPIQSGRDPSGRAWHDCEFVLALTEEVTEAEVRRLLLRRIRDATATANPRELVGLLNALRESTPAPVTTPGDNRDGGLVTWLNGGGPLTE
jgi:hypothetical protein